MQNIFIKSLKLQNYRNFNELELNIDNNRVMIIGENGSGKTNILEAISLLLPGRGLRMAKLDQLCKIGEDGWNLQTIVQSKIGLCTIDSGFKLGKRWIDFNGSKITNSELSKLVSIIWLTPQMDGIFLASASERRRFFDRIVYNFVSSHASSVNKYDYYLQERKKILQHNASNASWLDLIEDKIAETSLEIAKNRNLAINKLTAAISSVDVAFPQAVLSIDGEVETKSLNSTEESTKEFIKNHLTHDRVSDKLSGRTGFGVHRSDLVVIHKDKNQLAKLCSTGEQKSLLISLIIAEVISAINDGEVMPILLLDEIFVHLDEKRKQYLTEFLCSLNGQIFVTATEESANLYFAQSGSVIKI